MNTFTPAHMQRAIELSRLGMQAGAGGPFGAVIVKDGVIISEANNQVTSSNDPTAHAEMVAIRQACEALGDFQLEGCELYTSCEPCPMCLGAIYWARPSVVYYANTKADAAAIGFDDSFIYDQISTDDMHRQIPFMAMPSGEAKAVFDDWGAKPDKTMY